MRTPITPPLAACIAALVLAATAHAAPGTAMLSWNGCNTSPVTNLNVTAGEASGVNLYCFVIGQSDPTIAYQVEFLYGDASHLVPDAWRFDPVGCQGSAFIVLNHVAPASVAKTCPSFQGSGYNLQISIVDFSPPILPYPTTLMRIGLANSYPFTANAPVPGTTYFLMDAEFNHTYSVVGPSIPQVNCGGLEDPICFHLISASYLTADGTNTEIPFQFGGTGGYASANAVGGSCLVDPAHPATWGSIKAQYRN